MHEVASHFELGNSHVWNRLRKLMISLRLDDIVYLRKEIQEMISLKLVIWISIKSLILDLSNFGRDNLELVERETVSKKIF